MISQVSVTVLGPASVETMPTVTAVSQPGVGDPAMAALLLVKQVYSSNS
jgi:hypothetical protein